MDWGKGYRYAHDEEGAFAAGERYFPDGMDEQRLYQPVPRGLEIKIGDKLAQLRALNAAAREAAEPGVDPQPSAPGDTGSVPG
jgi:putative ATPase